MVKGFHKSFTQNDLGFEQSPEVYLRLALSNNHLKHL